MPGVHHHLIIAACHEAGFQDAVSTDYPVVWECGYEDLGKRTDILPNAPECSPNGRAYFSTQFQGGSADDGSLVLPHGTGVPVGSGSPFQTIVAIFHFPRTKELIHGSTAGSGFEVTFSHVPHNENMRSIWSLLIMADGFVGAHSVNTISGSWTLREQTVMHLKRLYTHWHEMNDMAIKIQVWIERTSGERDIILSQDPKAFQGISDVSNSTSAVIRTGDRLTIQCTYNNTSDRNIRVQ